GVSFLLTELNSKRLELLSELMPQARVIGLLVNPSYSGTEEIMRDTKEAARAKELQLEIVKARTEGEIDAAFPMLMQLRCGALIVGNDTFFDTRRERLVALASHMPFRRSTRGDSSPSPAAWQAMARTLLPLISKLGVMSGVFLPVPT